MQDFGEPELPQEPGAALAGPEEPAIEKGGQEPQKPLLTNPHEKKTEVLFDQAVLDWWKDQRTNILEPQKKDELLAHLTPDPSVSQYFKAPNAPPSVRESMRTGRSNAPWKDDNSLWSIQTDFVKASIRVQTCVQPQKSEQMGQVRAFQVESIQLAKSLVQEKDFMITIDLKDAYFMIPIHHADRKFLRFEWDGNLLEFQVLPFGLTTAPRVFTKVMKPVIAHLRQRSM